MDAPEFNRLIVAAMSRWAESTDELRDLDAALGDGDLGLTVGAGASAVTAALEALADDADVPAVLKAAAKAFSTANPSTMAALIGGGLLAAAKAVPAATEVGRAEAVAIGRAVADSIATRGKAAVGDKTILDALVPAVDAAEATQNDPLAAAVRAAAEGVESTAALQSQRGRAAWQGERSKGHQDPGAVAFLRFVEALHQEVSS